MAKYKFATEDELSTHLEATEEKLSSLDAVVKELGDSKKRELDLEKKLEQFEQKIKTLTISSGTRGNWKNQDTPEARRYGMGKMIMDMIRAKQSVGKNEKALEKHHMEVLKTGATAVRPAPGVHGWQDTEKVFLNGAGQKAGLSTSPLTGDDSVGSYGGSYTVPPEYKRELLRTARDASVMMGKVSQAVVQGIYTYFPKTSSNLTITKVTNQNTDKTETNLAFSQVSQVTEIYAGYVAVVEEYTEDAMIDLASLVQTMFGEAWGKKFDNICLSDTTYGAINTSGIQTYTLPAGNTSFSDLSVDDMQKVIEVLDSDEKRRGNEYFMHLTNWDTLVKEKDDGGNYILRKPSDAAQKQLHGVNLNTVDQLPSKSASAADTDFGLYINPKDIYVGNRIPLEFRIFDQTQSAMESGQIFLRIRVRMASKYVFPENGVKIKTPAS